MSALKNANLGLSFLLELSALAAFAYWGFRSSEVLLVKLALALVAPLLAAVVWSLLAAPKAPRRLEGWQLLAFKLLFFGLAVAALVFIQQPILAGILAIVVVTNLVLANVWGQK